MITNEQIQQFITELEKRLENDPKKRGGKLIDVKPTMSGGYDFVIEDKNGKRAIYFINCIEHTWMPVIMR